MNIASFIKNGIRSDVAKLWDENGGFESETDLVNNALFSIEDEWQELCCRESFVSHVRSFWADHK